MFADGVIFRTSLKAGDAAPDFALPDGEGQLRRLEDYKGRWLVLFFYPADFTHGCTEESCLFRDLAAQFAALGAEIVGVSGDSVLSHRDFAAAHKLGYPLLSDPARVARRAYGVPHRFGRLSGRVSFVIDPQGVIRHVFQSGSRAKEHVNRALDYLKENHVF